ncbi:hypothetical protein [Nitrincola tibetensis]|uniref:hypothetical protein n=1 Tax=Nitrincola tibetensis TaxID=2219697 RepID=UPI0012E35D01|nr:hypothetical protein [Nitrincola tibetensis]
MHTSSLAGSVNTVPRGILLKLELRTVATSFDGFTSRYAIKDQLEVGTVSGQGKVRTPIPAITAEHLLFPTSSTRTLNSSPYGSPATGRRYGLTEFHTCHMNGLGSAYPPVVILSAYSQM